MLCAIVSLLQEWRSPIGVGVALYHSIAKKKEEEKRLGIKHAKENKNKPNTSAANGTVPKAQTMERTEIPGETGDDIQDVGLGGVPNGNVPGDNLAGHTSGMGQPNPEPTPGIGRSNPEMSHTSGIGAPNHEMVQTSGIERTNPGSVQTSGIGRFNRAVMRVPGMTWKQAGMESCIMIIAMA